ncbi:DUF1367 family protein [Pantoea ananatis]|uniref:DUF1367 family protein n=1 Tax=Pantoea ananas TaxID=553 RepID=UPI001B3003BC|nr:DUF1367 family protein [Pantoea ananatis]
MAQMHLVKTSSTTMMVANAEAAEVLARIKTGAWLSCDVRQARNYNFHKRFFALLNLGFEYWTPTAGAVLESEKSLLRQYVDYLSTLTGQQSVLSETLDEFLSRTGADRAEGVELVKSFEAFRKWAVMTAGFYDEYILPDGTQRREAKSISFANMKEHEFQEVYKAVLNVLWYQILFRKFDSQQAAENAAAQLQEFAA